MNINFTFNIKGNYFLAELLVRIGKMGPKWQWLNKEGKSLWKWNKGRSEDPSEDFRLNRQPSWLAQFTQGRPSGRREGKKQKKHTKRGAGIELGAPLLFLSFGLACCLPPCLEGGCIFPCFLNKTAVTWAVTPVHPSLQIFVATRQNWGYYKHLRQNH